MLVGKWQKLQTQLRQVGTNLKEVAGATRQANQGFGEMLRTAMQKFPVWMISATIFYAPIRAMEDMTQRLMDIDKAMTEIRRVMDMPEFKFTELLQDAVDTSEELTTKLSDVLSIMGDFGRQGYEGSQLLDLTKTAQVMQNISDLDASSTVDSLVSAMVNFNVTAQDSITIANKLNEVDNNYAISTKDLADGIRKAGATAKTFQVDIDSLNGYITAIGTATRESGTIIGNSLKTIFSRITTMSEARTALQGIGVDIYDLQGQVKPVSTIIGEMAGKWDGLSASQKQNLAVTVAGRNQLNRLQALMNNYGIAVDATKTSINSQGSAMREQEKYAKSLEGRMNNLDTAYNKLAISFGDALVTDGLVDAITSIGGLATAISGLVNHVGVLGTVFGVVGIAVLALSKKFRILTVEAYASTTALVKDIATTRTLTPVVMALGGALEFVGVALKRLLFASLVGAVFAGIGYVLEKVVNHFADAKRASEDYAEQEKKNISALTESRDETLSLIKAYDEMSDKKTELAKTNSWTTQQESDYIDLQKRLAEIYPNLVKNIDGAGNAHLKNKKAIDKEIKATEDLILAKKEEQKVTALEDLQKDLNKRDGDKGRLKNLKKEYDDNNYTPTATSNKLAEKLNDKKLAQLNVEMQRQKKLIGQSALEINNQVLKIADAYEGLKIDPSIQKSVTDFIESLDLSKISSPEKLEKYSKQIGELTTKMSEAYDKKDYVAFGDAQSALQELGKKMNSTNYMTKYLTLSIDDLAKNAERMKMATYSGADGLADFDVAVGAVDGDTQALADELDNAKGSFDGIKSVIQDMVQAKQYDMALTTAQGDAYKTLVDEISPLNKALEDMANGKALTASEAMDLISQEKELAGAISIENGVVKVNEQAVADLRNTKVKSYTDMLTAIKNEAITNTNSTIVKLKDYGIELQAIATLADAKINLEKIDEEIYNANAKRSGWEVRDNVQDSAGKAVTAMETARTAIGGLAGLMKQLEALSGVTSTSLTQVGTSLEKNDDKTDKSTYVTDKYKLALDALNTSIAQQQALMEKYPSNSKQYQDAVKKEIELLKQKKTLIEGQTKALQAQVASGKVVVTGKSTTSTTTTTSGGKSASTPTSYASGTSNQASIWNFFKSKGFSDTVVSGIMGNIQAESGFRTTAEGPQTKNGRAYGIAQWLGGRRKGLEAYAKENGTSASDLGTQLNYLWKELQGSERKTLNYLNTNQGASASEIAKAWDKLFERSEGTTVGARQANANKILNAFGGGKGGTGYNTTSSGGGGLSTIKLGSSGDLVKQLQKALGISIDGIFGKATLNAVKAFQKKNGLTADGIVGSKTWSKLGVKSPSTGSSNGGGASASTTDSDAQQAIDDAKSQINQLEQDALDVQSQIEQLNMLLVQGQLSTFDNKIDGYKDDFAYLDRMQAGVKETSDAWRDYERSRIAGIKVQIQSEKEAITYLNNQIKSNKDLTEAQKEQLRQQVVDRTASLAQLQQSQEDSQRKIIDSENQVADQVIDAWKEYYKNKEDLELKAKDKELENAQKVHDQKVKMIDDELNAYKDATAEKLKTMNDEWDTSDYNDGLSQKQKERQKIIDQINQLSLDNSMEGQKKLADLKQELADKDQDIADYTKDRTRKVQEGAINDEQSAREKDAEEKKKKLDDDFQALQEEIDKEKEAITKHYEDLINDERHWAEVRKEILSGNVSSLSAILKTFVTDTSNNMGELGKSLQNQLIDKLNEAKGLLDAFNGTPKTPAPTKPKTPAPTKPSTPAPTKPSTPTKPKTPTKPTTPTKPKTPAPASNANKRKTTSAINFRSQPKYGNNVLMVIPKGATVDYAGLEQGWAKIKYNNKTGYVGTQYLKTFASGGFTGNWFGNDGKVALLHKKELVLNQGDTKNLLDSIKYISGITAFMDKIKLPRLNPIQQQPYGNTVNLTVNIDHLDGGKQGAEEFIKLVTWRLKGKGGIGF
jgi:TP901 family phage tail tape measure protein